MAESPQILIDRQNPPSTPGGGFCRTRPDHRERHPMNARIAATAAAARILGLRHNDAARNSRLLPDISAVHFWDPSRAGGSVIIGADGAYLCAGASVPWDRHLGDYTAGHRTPAPR